MSVHSGRLIGPIKAEKINTDQYKNAYRQYKLCSSQITMLQSQLEQVQSGQLAG